MEEEKKVSKFSSGLNILMRLDLLWKNCYKYKSEGRYYKWWEELDSVWLELARDLKPNEYWDSNEKGEIVKDSKENEVLKKGYKSQLDGFEKRMKELLPFEDWGNIGFKVPSVNMKERRNKQYKLLMEKQLFLARLENELGKGTSWGESEDDWD